MGTGTHSPLVQMTILSHTELSITYLKMSLWTQKEGGAIAFGAATQQRGQRVQIHAALSPAIFTLPTLSASSTYSNSAFV